MNSRADIVPPYPPYGSWSLLTLLSRCLLRSRNPVVTLEGNSCAVTIQVPLLPESYLSPLSLSQKFHYCQHGMVGICLIIVTKSSLSFVYSLHSCPYNKRAIICFQEWDTFFCFCRTWTTLKGAKVAFKRTFEKRPKMCNGAVMCSGLDTNFEKLKTSIFLLYCQYLFTPRLWMIFLLLFNLTNHKITILCKFQFSFP